MGLSKMYKFVKSEVYLIACSCTKLETLGSVYSLTRDVQKWMGVLNNNMQKFEARMCVWDWVKYKLYKNELNRFRTNHYSVMTCIYNQNQMLKLLQKNIFEKFSDLSKLSLCFNYSNTCIPATSMNYFIIHKYSKSQNSHSNNHKIIMH